MSLFLVFFVTDRLIMTMCSKLRTQSNTAGSDQAGTACHT